MRQEAFWRVQSVLGTHTFTFTFICIDFEKWFMQKRITSWKECYKQKEVTKKYWRPKKSNDFHKSYISISIDLDGIPTWPTPFHHLHLFASVATPLPLSHSISIWSLGHGWSVLIDGKCVGKADHVSSRYLTRNPFFMMRRIMITKTKTICILFLAPKGA